MWIACWNCGQDVWFETQKQCRHCGSIIRRCADCDNYEESDSTCTQLQVPVQVEEAHQPTRLAIAYNCFYFVINEAAMARPHLTAEQSASLLAKRETAQNPPKAAHPAPAAAAAPDQAPALGDAEVITIRREPALKRPRLPVIIAHRGHSAAAPENTGAAFTTALKAGAQAIELDVHISRDDQAIVIHDAEVDRTTNGQGPVAFLTLAELKALDAGSWFAPQFTGERLLTLEEAMEAIPAPTWLLVHLRAHENETDRCERAVAEAIARHQARGRTIVTHHTRHGLHRLREMEPRLRLCWIPPGGEPASEYVDDAYYMGYRFIQPRREEVDQELVDYAHERGMWVNVFWADEEEDMRRLVALGVDGIITNHPDRLCRLLQHTVRGG